MTVVIEWRGRGGTAAAPTTQYEPLAPQLLDSYPLDPTTRVGLPERCQSL